MDPSKAVIPRPGLVFWRSFGRDAFLGPNFFCDGNERHADRQSHESQKKSFKREYLFEHEVDCPRGHFGVRSIAVLAKRAIEQSYRIDGQEQE